MDRTPEQARAIETVGKNLCVDAGAGSGKTSVLVGRVLYLLEHDLASLDQIVAITFTDKAAAEMKDRLRREFHRRAPLDDSAQMSFWRDLERRAESARFTTIHAFCAGLLRENALALGADPDFTVLADAESFLMRDQVVDETLHASLDADDEAAMRVATELGLRALRELLMKLLKSRALMERIGREHPLHDPEALRAHWRGLAQLETRRRMSELPRSRALRQFQARLESFAGQCANPKEGRETLRREMLESVGRILRGADLPVIERELAYLAETSTRGSKKDWPSEQVHDALKKVQDKLKAFAADHLGPTIDEEVERVSAALTCDLHAVYQKAARAFQKAKAQRTAQDFDDLILATSDMLRSNAAVRARTARGIKYLLIDEFQDTDDRQLQIAEALCQEPGGPELFIVGDVKQSIYRFRGADVGVFAQARRETNETIELARNFRSLPDLIEFVNDFFERSGMVDAVERTYRPLQAHREATGEARVEFLLPAIDGGASAEACRREEAKLIASRLVQMCSGPERVQIYDPVRGATRPAEFGDVTMLFRASSSIYLYEQALREWGIPYTVVAGAGFYERQEVLDLRNMLALAADPWDEMALLAFLRSPVAGLSDDALAHLCENGSLAAAFADGRTPEGFQSSTEWAAARALIADLRANRERPLPDFLRFVLDRSGYEAVALSQFLGTQKALNLRKTLDLADDFARTRAGSLSAFVHYLDEISVESEIREGEAAYQSEDTGAVTLMTVHKSKGLEFGIVVLPDLARESRGSSSITHMELGMAVAVTGLDGETRKPAIYELIQKRDKEDDLAESGRVLYVALTRARDWLVLGGARNPERGGQCWLKVLDEAHDLSSRSDGEEFGGSGWRAIVRRGLAPFKCAETIEPSDVVMDRETLLRHVGPAPDCASQRAVYSVSQLLDAMGGAEDEEDERREEEDRPALAAEDARARGTLVHRMFELWDFASCDAPDVEALLRRSRVAPNHRGALATALVESAARFRRSSLWDRVAPDLATRREQPFVFRIGDALINGTMDLLLGDGAIIDYKTGKMRSESHARYERQLQLYAAAYRSLTGQTAPYAALYYVDDGSVHPVQVSEAHLAGALEAASHAIDCLRAATS